MSSSGLGAEVRSGTIWIFTTHFSGKLLSLGVGVVLARMLSPEDFGTVAIAMVVWQFIQVFGATGIGSKLIHQQELINEYATASFWLNVLVALALALAAVAVAPLAALFYESPLVTPVIWVLALCLVIGSIGSTHGTLLTKQMSFKSLSVISLGESVLSSLIALIMVLSGFGVWSLVLPGLFVTPFRVVALWLLNPWRPTCTLGLEYWRDIYSFGRYVLGTSVLRFINLRTDQLVIGKSLGTEALGLYSFGYSLANWPVENIVWVASRVTFPAFAKLQRDLDEMRRFYMKTIELISLVAFPCLVGLIVVADELIPLVYGAKWAGAIIPLKLILAFTLVRSIASPGGQLLMALGKPRKEFNFSLIQVVPLLVAVLVGTQFGINGIAAGVALVLTTFAIVFLRVCTREIRLPFSAIIRSILPAAACAGIMAVCVEILGVGLAAFGYDEKVVLVGSVFFGALVYSASLWLLFRRNVERAIQLVQGLSHRTVPAEGK